MRPPRLRDMLSGPLESHTVHTVTDRPELEAQLIEIRAAGVAYEIEEHNLGIVGVAAVVNDAGEPAASISLAVPTERWNRRRDELTAGILAARAQATRLLSA